MSLLDAPTPRDASGTAELTGGVRSRWRRDFVDTSLAAWDVVNGASSGGTDWSVNPATGVVTVGMGTSANADYTLVSKQSFAMPMHLYVGISISQKIANNEIYVELVGCNDAGVLDETVVAAYRIAGSDSTTTTTARAELRNGHTARVQSGNITTQTQTSMSILEIQAKTENIVFGQKAADSNAASSIAYTRNTQGLDPNMRYKIRLRARNGGTAPASSTTVTFSFVALTEVAETRVEISGGSGSSSQAGAIPVSVVNSGGVTNPALAPSATVTGLSIAKVNSAATTNATLIKSSSGRVYGYDLANTSASTWAFVKLYNSSAAPTVGTTTVAEVIALPPGQAARVTLPAPLNFGSGIGYSTVAGTGLDADTTAVAAQQVIGSIFWI